MTAHDSTNPVTSLPLTAIAPPEHRFVDAYPRRCPDPECNSVAYCVSLHRDRRQYACAMCAKPVDRDSMIRCPRCLGAAYITHDGAIHCAKSHTCKPVLPPYQEPNAEWESTVDFATMHDFTHALKAKTYWRGEGPLGGLALRYGYYEETRGEFVPGSGDAEWEAIRADNLKRIVEMTDALDEFGKVVLHDKSIKKTGTSWHREIGAAMAFVLFNSIVTRGGQYKTNSEQVRLGIRRATPFSGYRHALCTAVGLENPEAVSNGRGSGSLAYVSDNTYTHGLPGGILFQGEGMSVNPSRNGASVNTTSKYTGEDDALACIEAARIGGLWSRVEYGADGTVALNEHGCSKVARCDGGRLLTPVELELLRLCDAGESIPIGKNKDEKETRRLKVGEAVKWLKATDARRKAFPEARHLLERDAKTMLSRARRAVIEAMQAWQMIPVVVREPNKSRAQGAHVAGGWAGVVGEGSAKDGNVNTNDATRVRVEFDPGAGGWNDYSDTNVTDDIGDEGDSQ